MGRKNKVCFYVRCSLLLQWLRFYRSHKNKNPNRNKFGQQKRDRDTQPGFRGSYDAIPSENALYERFYKESMVVPEEEWEDFWGALKRTLPTTFRFTGSRGLVSS